MKLDAKIYNMNSILNLTGVHEGNIKVLEDYFSVNISIRGNEVFVEDCNPDVAKKLNTIFLKLIQIADRGVQLMERDIIYIIRLAEEKRIDATDELYMNRETITVSNSGRPICAKTVKQKEYIKALKHHDLVLSIGPAGTGKTYLAVVYAVSLLREGIIKKIILTRPAVEAGESLGFLPGDLKDKIDPYLTPLYDALYDVLGVESTKAFIEKGNIEIAPLAYMRGRTLENAFVILDEAQNTTPNQMKMFLTRLGFRSKMVVTGDITQVDLPKGINSGLAQAAQILADIKQIGIVEFNRLDVVRHPLVQLIIEKYEGL